MKKIVYLLTLFLFLLSISVAAYTPTATDISTGVFPEGAYYFPDTVYLGTESDPRLSTTQTMYVTEGDNDYGIYARSYGTDVAILGRADETKGVYGYSTNSSGVYGVTYSSSTSSAGVYGYATQGASGVYGYDASGSGAGVKAYSTNYGFYTSGAEDGIYVASATNYGGKFYGDNGGVYGEGDSYGGYFKGDTYAVYSYSGSNTGVYGLSGASSAEKCGIKGGNTHSSNYAYLGCSDWAIYTADNAKIEGTLHVGSCSGCDVAEHFLGDNLEAGDVVVLNPTKLRGVTKTTTPYNKLAAGVISTDPTLTMGIDEGFPIALAGVVPTKVIGTVHVGDLLTTSSTSGYAMACADLTKCTGAVIGKAMEENNAGKGKITALVMLG